MLGKRVIDHVVVRQTLAVIKVDQFTEKFGDIRLLRVEGTDK